MYRNTTIILTIKAVLQIFSLIGENDLCSHWVKTTTPLMHCCHVPIPRETNASIQIVEDLLKTMNTTSPKFYCHYTSRIFSALNLTNVNKDEMKAYISGVIHDPEWVEVLGNVSDFCIDKLPTLKNFYSKTLNISDDECDTKYMAFNDCLSVHIFKDCPMKSFTNTHECAKTKNFMKRCHNDDATMIAFSKKHQNWE